MGSFQKPRRNPQGLVEADALHLIGKRFLVLNLARLVPNLHPHDGFLQIGVNRPGPPHALHVQHDREALVLYLQRPDVALQVFELNSSRGWLLLRCARNARGLLRPNRSG